MNSVVQGAVSKIISAIVTPLIEFIFALAVLYFIWGAAGFILNKGEDSDKRKTSQMHLLYGVIGMFIMVSAYGIIRFIASTLLSGCDPFSGLCK